MIKRIFPFIGWLKGYTGQDFKIDLVAGITVALVLIPQSMAYAQLAGLPAYYGLYASFLPPMIAALFGSSRQLATGPVAVVSLMTLACLEPLATVGSEAFIAYAILLAITVGIFQLFLGIFRLGLIINLLSHPVVNGFTNAAAIIIASSQLSKLFGVYVDSAPHHYQTIIHVIESALNFTHIPTLLMGIFALALMYALKRLNNRIPYVLIAVLITTLIAWATEFEHNKAVPLSNIESVDIRQTISQFNKTISDISSICKKRASLTKRIQAQEKLSKASLDAIMLDQEMKIINFQIKLLKDQANTFREKLRNVKLSAAESDKGIFLFYPKTDEILKKIKTDGRTWRIKIGNKVLDENSILLMGGGAVVGQIPRGIPALSIPKVNLSIFFQLFNFAVIISLLGFMEAIAIAKAMAAKTGQRLDPNQELIGQGFANILGAVGKSYPVSGSFSRSAVNLQAGAISGISSVITSMTVVVTLIFFTSLLYHLPQAVLAAVIMMAVFGLVNVSGFIHAWKAKWYDGAISIITFISTLALAPHLEKGIYIGVSLSLIVFFYKCMRPKVTSLSRHEDAGLRDHLFHDLIKCAYIDLIRFEGPLFFANASYLEDEVNNRVTKRKNLKHIIIAAQSISDIDASGEETLALIVERLRSGGFGVSFSGVNESVMEVFKHTHLLELIGPENIYPTMERAILAIHEDTHQEDCIEKEGCPLLTVCRNNESNESIDAKGE